MYMLKLEMSVDCNYYLSFIFVFQSIYVSMIKSLKFGNFDFTSINICKSFLGIKKCLCKNFITIFPTLNSEQKPCLRMTILQCDMIQLGNKVNFIKETFFRKSFLLHLDTLGRNS